MKTSDAHSAAATGFAAAWLIGLKDAGEGIRIVRVRAGPGT
jgi:hypothetical protein